MVEVSDDELAIQYAKLRNVWKVGELYGMKGGTVHYKLKKLGVIVPMRVLSAEEKQKIRALYENGFQRGDGQFQELALEINRARVVIERYAKSIGLSRKNKEYSPAYKAKIGKRTKKMIEKNGHPRGMLGKKHTKETLRKMSFASITTWNNFSEEQKAAKTDKMIQTRIKNGTLVHPRPEASWKAGWREIGGKKNYYRSTWEANYARYLEWLKTIGEIKDWEHEPTTFWFDGIKRGCRSYLPDFLVIEKSGKEAYHEVKGWMDDRSKTKIRRMAKYYPNVPLIVIDAKQYQAIKSKVSGIVPGWEMQRR